MLAKLHIRWVENITPHPYENHGLNTWCHTLFYRHSSSGWKYVYLTSQFDTEFLANTKLSLIITSENRFLSLHLARSWQPCLRHPGFITSHWTGAKQQIWAQGTQQPENLNLLRFNKISPQHQELLKTHQTCFVAQVPTGIWIKTKIMISESWATTCRPACRLYQRSHSTGIKAVYQR